MRCNCVPPRRWSNCQWSMPRERPLPKGMSFALMRHQHRVTRPPTPRQNHLSLEKSRPSASYPQQATTPLPSSAARSRPVGYSIPCRPGKRSIHLPLAHKRVPITCARPTACKRAKRSALGCKSWFHSRWWWWLVARHKHGFVIKCVLGKPSVNWPPAAASPPVKSWRRTA